MAAIGLKTGYPTGHVYVVRGRYDFSKDGGAVGSIPLADPLPAGTYILSGVLEVDTALTSGGSATAAIQLEAANDLVNAALLSAAPWSSSTGRKAIIPAGTGSTSVRTTAARTPTLVVATAALTAGVFDLILVCTQFPD
ncbi:MAG: hypothetical protein J2P17_14990 [Mycobacterium sp.]|nr:hypothetical protein [Mycobacterium sp.]